MESINNKTIFEIIGIITFLTIMTITSWAVFKANALVSEEEYQTLKANAGKSLGDFNKFIKASNEIINQEKTDLAALQQLSPTHNVTLTNGTTLIYNLKDPNIPIQNQIITWKNYSNNEFGFRIEYPSDWIVKEKQNRFEPGIKLIIRSTENPSSSIYSDFAFGGSGPISSSDVATLTEDEKKQTIDNNLDINDERHLVEDVNTSKYIIDGERAGSFTYGDLNKGAGVPLLGVESINTIHNGNYYVFGFASNAKHFDDTQASAIRTHMLNSFKWLR
jgi:hypothetical protein